jgi:AcrR family transcriptional regulator
MARAAQVVSAPRGLDSKRAGVLAAALELFAQRGYHGTSVPEVIARAGVGASTLYRLYPSKEALVNAVFVVAKERLERALSAERADEATLSPRARFCALWGRLGRFARDETTAFHFLELQDHTAYLDGTSRAVELRVLGPIFAACSEFQAVGAFSRAVPPDVIMAFVWGAFVGLLKAERTGYLSLDDKRLDAACDAAWRAFAIPDRTDKSAEPNANKPDRPHKQKRRRR